MYVSTFSLQHQVTALHLASIEGHYDVAQLLLEKGAWPNARMDVSIIMYVCDYHKLGSHGNMKKKVFIMHVILCTYIEYIIQWCI